MSSHLDIETFICVFFPKGFVWHRQLVFRSKLTMHTAYDRKDNTEPASITALAVSKDHKTLYVGDARGRVFSWSVTEQPNRGMADHWLKDEGIDYNRFIQYNHFELIHFLILFISIVLFI